MSTLNHVITTAAAVVSILVIACSEPARRDEAEFTTPNPNSPDASTSSGGAPTSDGPDSPTSTSSSTSAPDETTTDDMATIATTLNTEATQESTLTSSGGDESTTGEHCDDHPDTLIGPEYSLGPKFAGHYTIYDLGEVPGIEGIIGGTVIGSADPDSLLILGPPSLPPARLYTIGLARGSCGHITGLVGIAQPIADVPQAESVIFVRDDLMLLTVDPTNKLYQLKVGESTPATTYDFDVLGEVQHTAAGIGIVPADYGLPVPTLCFSSYPTGAFTCGELKTTGPLAEISGLTQMSTYSSTGNGFTYVPDDLQLPGFASHSLLGSESGFGDVVAYRCDNHGIPIYESGETFVTGGTSNVSIDPTTGDIIISTLHWPGEPFNHLLLVRPSALTPN
jgi:hypothetical protein